MALCTVPKFCIYDFFYGETSKLAMPSTPFPYRTIQYDMPGLPGSVGYVMINDLHSVSK